MPARIAIFTALMLLRPASTSSNASVQVQPECGVLDFSADLSPAEPVSVGVEGPWIVDWRGVRRPRPVSIRFRSSVVDVRPRLDPVVTA